MENEITVATSRGPVRFHSVGNAIAGIPAKYVKVRFTGKAGETAGIVIEATKAKAMSIPDLHFHDLRHEGTSRLFEQGYEVQQVALVTGHKDWRHLKRYTNLRPEDLHR